MREIRYGRGTWTTGSPYGERLDEVRVTFHGLPAPEVLQRVRDKRREAVDSDPSLGEHRAAGR